MEFLIAGTFTGSLGRLTGDELKAVKTTAFDLQMSRASPGQNFGMSNWARARRLWSVRANETNAPEDRITSTATPTDQPLRIRARRLPPGFTSWLIN